MNVETRDPPPVAATEITRPQDIKTSLAAQVSGQIKAIEGTIEPTAIEATALRALEPPGVPARRPQGD